MQGDHLTVQKNTIRKTIEYAEGRTNVHRPIITGPEMAMEKLGKIEEKSTSLLKGPELRLEEESLGTRPRNQESLASIVSARSIDSNSSKKQIMNKESRYVNLDTTGTRVLEVKQTRSGDILLKQGRGSDRTAFTVGVERAILGLGQVKKEERKATLEIGDMDSKATKEEIRAAIERALRKPDNGRRVTLLRSNTRGLRMTIVILRKREAEVLLEIGHIRGPCKL
ncbi:hypothetical protein TSAR_009140 [Trichomalopsis sarcophagae]|uniref:Uncharacterized protein n=1 Tax=Trichomalopsis sarcophagae TaxID=543379 RepID=A0A232FCG0_9HYME|nr:hypothetical protein TSAR_009140 [Trichomalopsis sarcophagae]